MFRFNELLRVLIRLIIFLIIFLWFLFDICPRISESHQSVNDSCHFAKFRWMLDFRQKSPHERAEGHLI